MKLLYCINCRDVFNLALDRLKRCSCGAVSGQYVDDQNATYSGKAIPFAVDNASFLSRAKDDELRNPIYDAFYGEGKIQCWILKEGEPNFDQIKKVKEQKRLGACR